MSADIMYATRNPTCPRGNPSDRCHSVQVRSAPNAKYNPQRLHTHEIVHLLHLNSYGTNDRPPPPTNGVLDPGVGPLAWVGSMGGVGINRNILHIMSD